MYTSRDKVHSVGPCCFSPPANCYCPCRTASPPPTRRSSRHLCDCPICNPVCSPKTGNFDHKVSRFGRSRSVNRIRPDVPCRNACFAYRPVSPTLYPCPNSAFEENRMLEYANLNVLLRRLSILQLEMKGLLNGKSLKERVQNIDNDDPHLRSSKANPFKDVPHHSASKPYSEKCLNHSQFSAHQRQYCLHRAQPRVEKYKWQPSFFQRKDLGRSLSPYRKKEDSPAESFTEELSLHSAEHDGKQGSRDGSEDDSSEWKEKKKIFQLWRDYNCDLHLKRIIDGSRKEAACRLVERIIHSKLTYYMLQYIGSVAKGLIGDDKTYYLSFFKTDGLFKHKPLNEGTYCELLSFVDKQAHPAKDLIKALEVSEEGMEEELNRGSYNANAYGDIRAQMRVFISVVTNVSTPHANHVSVSQALTDDDQNFFSKDLLQDLLKAADGGKLGGLQNAYKLVKLACYMALKRVESSA
ncbi:hypothetical protein KP509_14G070600 [Ceratopteris richardii]|uniref:Uncharacterized protein n=1 Tax=Ceratopteris richardii TaxID=49495 RepID=A0A8T2T915_CERRI|nr:hypothetical protein KP509_14G070600 [Ceratopteris richardii]